MYNRGNLTQYEQEQSQAQQDADWTEDEIQNGKIGFCMGIPAPDKCRTTKMFDKMPHPENENDYIWPGDTYTEEQVKEFGFLQDDQEI